jgi:hypothetical protein
MQFSSCGRIFCWCMLIGDEEEQVPIHLQDLMELPGTGAGEAPVAVILAPCDCRIPLVILRPKLIVGGYVNTQVD